MDDGCLNRISRGDFDRGNFKGDGARLDRTGDLDMVAVVEGFFKSIGRAAPLAETPDRAEGEEAPDG